VRSRLHFVRDAGAEHERRGRPIVEAREHLSLTGIRLVLATDRDERVQVVSVGRVVIP